MTTTCAACGKELEAGHKFCGQCGTPAPGDGGNAETVLPWAEDANALSPNIRKDDKGVYRWAYDLSLYRNPTILFLIWKIFFGIVVGMFLFFGIVDVARGYSVARAFGKFGVIPFVVMGIIFAVSILGYLLYAVVMGGKYCILFEMDEVGVNHIQLPSQFKKARVMGILGALAGFASGNMSMAGQGLITANRPSMYSGFSGVRKVVARKGSHLIKVKGLLRYNMVYADPEDFDAVYEYIRSHCPRVQQ